DKRRFAHRFNRLEPFIQRPGAVAFVTQTGGDGPHDEPAFAGRRHALEHTERTLFLESVEDDETPARADEEGELLGRIHRACAHPQSAVTRITSSKGVMPSASLRSAPSRSVSMPSRRPACAISVAPFSSLMSAWTRRPTSSISKTPVRP